MIHIHQLGGCAPAPLAHYLKAIGILRLVSEQIDKNVRGWWKGSKFYLATELDRKGLVEFFLCKYRPTPMFNPWGGRSGFYEAASEKTARENLKKIEDSDAKRLSEFRHVAADIRKQIDENKPSTDDEKAELIHSIRAKIRGASTHWLDTVIALVGAGDKLRLEQPAIFGTGGNEGSGGYPSAYMEAIVETVLDRKWDFAIFSCLFGDIALNCRWDRSFGQFMPSGEATPWDLLFAFEGACALHSSVSNKQTTTMTMTRKWMSSPFYVAPRSGGYISASRLDEKEINNQGKEQTGRGEQWFPVWNKPCEFSEVANIFLGGRAVARSGFAADGWSMARAVSGFGVSRGISEFVRYGYQQRNGKANFAVPLGRFPVANERGSSQSCLDDIDKWLSGLHWVCHPSGDKEAKNTPARLTVAYRRLVNALFAVIGKQSLPRRWQNALSRLGEIEAVMRSGTGFSAGPIPRLRPEWAAVANDGTPEFRLALVFALQFHKRDTGQVDTVRRHWIPLDEENSRRFATTGTDSAPKLKLMPDVVMHGPNAESDAIALVRRRAVEGVQHDTRYLPLQAAKRASAGIADLTALLSGNVNLNRVMRLARGLMALNHDAWDRQGTRLEAPAPNNWPDDAWLAIRLCTLPWPVKMDSGFELDVKTDPAIIRRLAAGDANSAVSIALRRLAAAGVRCPIRAGAANRDTAKTWAAALAFPVSKKTAKRFLLHLNPNIGETT